MLGRAVTGFIAQGRPYKGKDGKTRRYFDCKFIKKWVGGKDKVISGGNSGVDDDIPF